MSERDAFEQRLEAAVRAFVETAPQEIDAARLTRTLATEVPRVRRLLPRRILPWSVLRPPNPTLAWIAIAALLVVLGLGLVATGALRDVLPGPIQPSPVQPTTILPTPPPLATPPVVIASPIAQAPSPSAELSEGGRGQPVVITSLMVISVPGPNSGTFDVTAPADASGLVCPHGTVVDLVAIDAEAFANGQLLDFTIPKEFTCDDASGTFVVELQINIEPVSRAESFTWRVLRGTGAYTHLQGAGNGTTVSAGSSQAVNTLTGSLVD
jgi:hypothetical protein